MDKSRLRKHIGDKDWNRFLTNKSAEEAWVTFKDILNQGLAKFVPRSTVRTDNTPKWLTRELIKLVRRKKRA